MYIDRFQTVRFPVHGSVSRLHANHNYGATLGDMLGSLWGHCGVILDSLWDHVGVIVGSFLGTLGHILGHLFGTFVFVGGGRGDAPPLILIRKCRVLLCISE